VLNEQKMVSVERVNLRMANPENRERMVSNEARMAVMGVTVVMAEQVAGAAMVVIALLGGAAMAVEEVMDPTPIESRMEEDGVNGGTSRAKRTGGSHFHDRVCGWKRIPDGR